MSNEFYIKSGNQKLGPYSKESLHEYVSDRKTYVWREGYEKWQRIDRVEELVDVIAKIPPSMILNKDRGSRYYIILGFSLALIVIVGLLIKMRISEKENLARIELSKQLLEQEKQRQKFVDSCKAKLVTIQSTEEKLNNQLINLRSQLNSARDEYNHAHEFQLFRTYDERSADIQRASYRVDRLELDIQHLTKQLNDLAVEKANLSNSIQMNEGNVSSSVIEIND